MIGLIIAVVAGFVYTTGNVNVALVLGVLGIIVGLLNIADKEVQLFLVAAIAFIVSASALGGVFSRIPGLEAYAPSVFNYIIVFTAPAAAVASLKALYECSKA